jgi:hypothetical protein
MSAIGEAKARIRQLKESLEEQIGLLDNQKTAVDSLRTSMDKVFAQSGKGVDSTIVGQLAATTQGLDTASSRLRQAIAELDVAAAML